MSIVHTESLTKVYGAAAQPIYALNEIDLAVEEGEFLAIMGPSGSGRACVASRSASCSSSSISCPCSLHRKMWRCR
jgi:ABC-type dipeptide/oligopeptide/nickel transport system ATPase subunit